MAVLPVSRIVNDCRSGFMVAIDALADGPSLTWPCTSSSSDTPQCDQMVKLLICAQSSPRHSAFSKILLPDPVPSTSLKAHLAN